jgi:hypothetical protein
MRHLPTVRGPLKIALNFQTLVFARTFRQGTDAARKFDNFLPHQ